MHNENGMSLVLREFRRKMFSAISDNAQKGAVTLVRDHVSYVASIPLWDRVIDEVWIMTIRNIQSPQL